MHATNFFKMNTSLGSCRKRKRGGEKLLGFHNFCDAGFPANFNGAFHQNIKTLLEFGRQESPKWNGLETWSFQLELRHGQTSRVSLFIIEEPIEKSMYGYCGHCRSTGWGHHFVSNKRFHFVLPSKETTMKFLTGDEFPVSGLEVTPPISSCVHDLPGHLMHGVLHSNGFGHLISLSGVSGFLTGHLIMDFWDRICTGLRARKISLDDVAKKKSMDLRLIHGVAYGEPWFGRWGYKFGHGSYGITQHMHQKAIEAIRSIPISLLAQNFGSSNQRISEIISRYQSISSNSLQTLGHLISFMMELKDHLPPETQHGSNRTSTISHPETITCRWSLKRVEMATQVIIEALKMAKTRWVPRQEIRDTARAYIGDTGLLDFVLKSLGNHVVGNYMVHRAINPVTKVLEYYLEDLSNSFPLPNQEIFSQGEPKTETARLHVTRLQLMKDLFYFYKNVLKDSRQGGAFTVIPTASRIILDTKHLIKDYRGEFSRKTEVGNGQERVKLLCTVFLRQEEERDQEGRRNKLPPCELIVLNALATAAELKREVERIFREMYWSLRSFVAESIMDLSVKDSDLVFELAKLGCTLVIAGSSAGNGRQDEMVYERGNDNWIVDCPCGAKDDDGENMISCDICDVWQHSRCVQISNSDDASHIFLCNRCEHEIVAFPSLF